MKEGWKTIKLNDACFVDYGTRVVKKRDGGNIYPVYGGGGATFKMDTYNREDCLVVGRFAMSEKCTRFVKGKFFLNDSGLTVRPKDKALSQSLLDWALIAKNDNIYSFGKGSAQKNLDMDDFRDMELSYPTDLAEQQRIVDILDAEFAKIDALKANAEKNLQNAKDLFQAALTVELTPKDGWKSFSISSVSTDSKNIKWKDVDDDEQFKYIDLTSVDRASKSITEPQQICKSDAPSRAQRIVRADDIIFATTRPTLRRYCVIPNEYDGQICSTGYCVIRPKKEQVIPSWLYYILSTDDFYDYVEPLQTGATYPAITDKDVRGYIASFPTIAEQKAIVSRLDALNDRCKTLQENYTKTLALCDDLKQALLRKAFSGAL